MTLAPALLRTASLALAAAPALHAQVPLPVDRSCTLTEEESRVYTVEGRVTIPRGVHVSCQRGTRVEGLGEGATLVVEGSFSVVGTNLKPCAVDDLAIELAPGYKDVRFAETTLATCRIVTAKDRPASEGTLQLEACRLPSPTAIDVSLIDGEVHLLGTSPIQPMRITGLPYPVGERLTENRASVLVSSGSLNDLDVHGVAKFRVRHAFLKGATSFGSCGDLMIDGCSLSGKLTIAHDEPGGLKDTRLTKCDFTLDELALRAPGSKRSTVTIDKPWFDGLEDESAVREKVLRDGKDDELNGALVVLKKLRKEPNGFAGR